VAQWIRAASKAMSSGVREFSVMTDPSGTDAANRTNAWERKALVMFTLLHITLSAATAVLSPSFANKARMSWEPRASGCGGVHLLASLSSLIKVSWPLTSTPLQASLSVTCVSSHDYHPHGVQRVQIESLVVYATADLVVAGVWRCMTVDVRDCEPPLPAITVYSHQQPASHRGSWELSQRLHTLVISFS
jgi:hypothetical protein